MWNCINTHIMDVQNVDTYSTTLFKVNTLDFDIQARRCSLSSPQTRYDVVDGASLRQFQSLLSQAIPTK